MMLFRVFAFVIENQLYKETETLHIDRKRFFGLSDYKTKLGPS